MVARLPRSWSLIAAALALALSQARAFAHAEPVPKLSPAPKPPAKPLDLTAPGLPVLWLTGPDPAAARRGADLGRGQGGRRPSGAFACCAA